LDAEGWQFLEDFAGHQVITRGFLKREVFDYCLHLGSFSWNVSSWKGVSRNDVRVSSGRESGSGG
jgi:hypothetical protein